MPAPESPHAPTSRRRFTLAFAAAALATIGFAGWIKWHTGGEKSVLYFSDAGQVLAPFLATVACYRAGRRHEQRLRLSWWLLSAACGSWMLGQMIWSGYDLAGFDGPPIPSWADVGFLAFIPLAAGALFCRPSLQGSGTRRARAVLDGLAVAAALLLISWTFVLGPLWHKSRLNSLGGVVTFAYPFGDVVIGFFVILALRRLRSADRLVLWCVLAGLGAFALADSTYAYVVVVKGYTTGNLLDAGWFAGFLGIALGALASQPHDHALRDESPLPALPSLVAPLLPMLIALTVTGIRIRLKHLPDGVAVVMVLALVVLALVRQALLVVDFVAAGRDGGQGNVFERLARAALGVTTTGIAADEPSRTQPSEEAPK